jgi:hypothetical protein
MTGERWFEKKFKVIDELALELDAFADSIRRNREPEPNGVQGMRDVAVMEAIYQSAREGRTVPITMPEWAGDILAPVYLHAAPHSTLRVEDFRVAARPR